MRQRATAQTSIANRGRASLSTQVAALFASLGSTPKLWLDPSDRATLWQDSAGTTPVVSAGDPIGRILDKSGAGILATQGTTTSRPLWQTTYASFDGVDDSWSTSSIDFTSTDKVTVIAGVRKMSDAARGVVCELGPNFATSGAFAMFAPWTPGAGDYLAGGTGAGGTAVTVTASGSPAPSSAVLTQQVDLAGANPASRVSIRVNGVQTSASTGTTGGGNFTNQAINLGRRVSLANPLNGGFYPFLIIGRLLTAHELSLCERYMAQKSGVQL